MTLDYHGKGCVLPAPTTSPSPPLGDYLLPPGQVFGCPVHPVVPGTLPWWLGAPRDTVGLGDGCALSCLKTAGLSPWDDSRNDILGGSTHRGVGHHDMGVHGLAGQRGMVWGRMARGSGRALEGL